MTKSLRCLSFLKIIINDFCKLWELKSNKKLTYSIRPGLLNFLKSTVHHILLIIFALFVCYKKMLTLAFKNVYEQNFLMTLIKSFLTEIYRNLLTHITWLLRVQTSKYDQFSSFLIFLRLKKSLKYVFTLNYEFISFKWNFSY